MRVAVDTLGVCDKCFQEGVAASDEAGNFQQWLVHVLRGATLSTCRLRIAAVMFSATSCGKSW